MIDLDASFVAKNIIKGDKRSLSKAITLCESSLPDHQKLASQILDQCLPHTGKSIRIAITGVPGVGKSTFIDVFGNYLITQHNKHVAVLAVDPTSQQTRGSILGDKTRMNLLSMNESAFIRPSPSGDTLGGVAAQTRESILLCEACGFDIILVETVGVGQSETLVHDMVDFFLLLLLPGAGDELQGIKRGIVEMADMIAINKSETNPRLAQDAFSYYRNALQLIHSTRSNWQTPVQKIDSVTLKNIDTIWNKISEFYADQKKNGWLDENRKKQATAWFEKQIEVVFLRRLKSNENLQQQIEVLSEKVKNDQLSPSSAAFQLVDTGMNLH